MLAVSCPKARFYYRSTEPLLSLKCHSHHGKGCQVMTGKTCLNGFTFVTKFFRQKRRHVLNQTGEPTDETGSGGYKSEACRWRRPAVSIPPPPPSPSYVTGHDVINQPSFLCILDRRWTDSPVCKMNVAIFSTSSSLPLSFVCICWLSATQCFLVSAKVSNNDYVRMMY